MGDLVEDFITRRNERAAATHGPAGPVGGDYRVGGRDGTNWAEVLARGPRWHATPAATRDQAGRFARPTGDDQGGAA